MAKKKLHIEVREVSNGYVLIVGEKEYMAFNVEQLINIFFTHVAVGKTEYLDQDMSAAILTAAATWKTVGDALEANAVWISAARKAEKHEQAAIRAQANANERAEKAEREARRYYEENVQLRLDVDMLEKKLKGIGTKLVGGSHPDVIQKPDYKIRKVDFDEKPVKRRGRKPKTTTKKKATKK